MNAGIRTIADDSEVEQEEPLEFFVGQADGTFDDDIQLASFSDVLASEHNSALIRQLNKTLVTKSPHKIIQLKFRRL